MSFKIEARIYYEDTDAGGIVYHANYLKFCERARTEWVRAQGCTQQHLLDQGYGFVLTKLVARYHKSAKLDDMISVSCEIKNLRRTTIEFYQEVSAQDGSLLFSMQCQVAFINLKTLKIIPLDKQLVEHAQEQIQCDDKRGVQY